MGIARLINVFIIIILLLGSLPASISSVFAESTCKIPERNCNPLDIVFVIDRSGSMAWNDPDEIRKQGITAVIDELFYERENFIDRAAVIEFDGNTSILSDLTNDYYQLEEAINKVGRVGGTNIYGAMNDALKMLEADGRRSDKRVILLTDGEDNRGYIKSEVDKINDKANELGVTIHSIGFGKDGVDGKLLSDISLPNNGSYDYVESAEDIVIVFLRITSLMNRLELTGDRAYERLLRFALDGIDVDSLVVDPIHAATGAQLLERTIFSISGTVPLEFNIRYSSLLKEEGTLGKGWVHDFEARLEFLPNNSITLHWNPNHRTKFRSNDGNRYYTYDVDSMRDTLVRNNDGTYTLRKPDQRKFEFDQDGKLIRVVNRQNQPLEVRYDQNGRVFEVANFASRTFINFEYDDKGRIAKVIDPLRREYRFLYDSRNLLIKVLDMSKNRTIDYLYDENDRLISSSMDGYQTQLFFNEYDDEGRIASQTDALNLPTFLAYDEDSSPGNIITTITNRLGDQRVLTHDANYRLLSVLDEEGNEASYQYNASGLRTAEISPLGDTTTYEYDSANNLIGITDPLGNKTVMTYDERRNVTSLKNPDGDSLYFVYDQNNNVTKVTDAEGNSTSYTYDNNGAMLSKTNSNGATTKFEYTNGYMTKMIAPEGVATYYEYDRSGRMISVSDANNNKTEFEYDDADNITKVTDALGNSTEFTYDGYGNILTITNGRGHTTTYEYNMNQKLISTTDALGNKVRFTYDKEDRLTKITDAKGNSTSFAYDKVGNLTKVTNALGYSIRQIYDKNSNLIAINDATDQQIISIKYDAGNNPVEIGDAFGNIVEQKFDSLGRVTTQEDAMGREYNFVYNQQNRLSKVTDPLENEVEQNFNSQGKLDRVTDANGNIMKTHYDKADRITKIDFQDGQSINYSYNQLGQLDEVVNARGQSIKYEYDELGRVKSLSTPEGNTSYSYDENGNVIEVQEDNGISLYEYDELDRIVKYQDVFGNAISYEYDANSNLTRLIYPDGKQVSYEYDAINQLTKVVDWAGRETSYSYNPNGRLIETKKSNSSIEKRQYDKASRIVNLQEKSNVEVISDYNFDYDQVGNIVSENNAAQEPVISNVNTEINYLTGNQIDTINQFKVQYDADGNMTDMPINGEMVSLEYNSQNRLIRADETTYEYDANNSRIVQNKNGEITRYVVNPVPALSQVLMETNSNGEPIKYYVYGLGLIGEESTEFGYLTYHYDVRGNTVALTDEQGKVTDRISYSPYGQVTNKEGSTNTPFLYNGQYGVMTDDSGLNYMRERYYNPEIGKFISKDIYMGTVTEPLSLNLYIYTPNNPISFIDPLGTSWLTATLGAVGLAAGVVAMVATAPAVVTTAAVAGVAAAAGGAYFTHHDYMDTPEEERSLGNYAFSQAVNILGVVPGVGIAGKGAQAARAGAGLRGFAGDVAMNTGRQSFGLVDTVTFMGSTGSTTYDYAMTINNELNPKNKVDNMELNDVEYEAWIRNIINEKAKNTKEILHAIKKDPESVLSADKFN